MMMTFWEMIDALTCGRCCGAAGLLEREIGFEFIYPLGL